MRLEYDTRAVLCRHQRTNTTQKQTDTKGKGDCTINLNSYYSLLTLVLVGLLQCVLKSYPETKQQQASLALASTLTFSESLC